MEWTVAVCIGIITEEHGFATYELAFEFANEELDSGADEVKIFDPTGELVAEATPTYANFPSQRFPNSEY